jgi:uncharacterized membrane protein (DUF4010 family)
MQEPEIFKISLKLLLSLVIGVLFGIERDIKRVSARVVEDEGRHFGGIRTFALIGLLGGLLGYLGTLFDHPVYIYGFIAVAVFLASSYIIEHRRGGSLGMTTEFSALLAYTLGTLSVLAPLHLVVAFAILSLFLLSQKKTIGAWSAKIKPAELLASLKFALVLFVIFPFLKGMPPVFWRGVEVIDPFRVWKMVVMISSISYVGYFLARVLGERRGIFVTGVLGGLASSTAVTHAMAVKAASVKHRESSLMLAAAALFANAVSFLRVALILALLNLPLVRLAILPLATMFALSALPGLYLMQISGAFGSGRKLRTEILLESPFSLKPALFFGLLYAVVIFLVQFAKWGAGDAGVYLLSMISGFPDVDAITVTLANLANLRLTYLSAIFALVLGLGSNMIFKSLIARAGGPLYWKWITGVFIAVFLLGIAAAGSLFLFY